MTTSIERKPDVTTTLPLFDVWPAFCALPVSVPDEPLRVPVELLPEAEAVCEPVRAPLLDGVAVARAANNEALSNGTQLLDAGTRGW